MVERDVGGERVDELVLSHERVLEGIEFRFRHFRILSSEMTKRIPTVLQVLDSGDQSSEILFFLFFYLNSFCIFVVLIINY